MKIESISIQNFKLFENHSVSFKNKTLSEVSNRFLALGDNGSGKTTLLQAIALPLALATRQIQSVSDFNWLGFLPGRLWQSGIPRIHLEVSFEPEEIETTREVAQNWYAAQPKEFQSEQAFIEPGDSHCVQVSINGDYWKAGQTPAERLQFQGRYYAKSLLKSNSSVRALFSKLPCIFWFDQFRNLRSNPYADSMGELEKPGRISFELGVGLLRQYLIEWQRRRESGNQADSMDYLSTLENLYTSIFPERSFVGLQEIPSIDSPTAENAYFVINDGHHTYDIVEMSAGEQSVFPILYEFVRQQIAYSIVLIDEIDLNLHPPAAQFLVRQLPKIGPTCQFIFTTHSEAVSDIIGEEDTYRLLGGSLCL